MTINNKFAIGEQVKIKLTNIEGFINSIIIRENLILDYEVSYFVDQEYRSANFSQWQLE
jgi:hypothetical protein